MNTKRSTVFSRILLFFNINVGLLYTRMLHVYYLSLKMFL
jgi:hypothetical protein